MNKAEKTERWRVALHEASHALVGDLHGVRPMLATIWPDGGGSCRYIGSAGDAYVEAVVAASGPAGEKLADTYSAPTWKAPHTKQRRNRSSTSTATAGMNTADVVAGLLSFIRADAVGPSDWQVVAMYSCNNEDSTTWLARKNRVEVRAARFVEMSKRTILLLATRLYVKGVLDADDFNEILPRETAGDCERPALRVATDTPD